MTIEDQILAIAKRRTIYAGEIARQLGITRKAAQKAIASLRKAGFIYTSDNAKRNFWGSGEAGYRANITNL
jgi:DNA-binding MarR family transcriptional regulator